MNRVIDLKIRNMLKTDMPQLAVLYKQFWNEDSNILAMEEQFNRLSKQEAYILLSATIKDKLVGSVMGIVCQELYGNCMPFLVLENMIVDKSVRRRGIGKCLIQKLEEIARLKNCTQIILVTEMERIDACSFYESCGFQLNNKGYKKKL